MSSPYILQYSRINGSVTWEGFCATPQEIVRTHLQQEGCSSASTLL